MARASGRDANTVRIDIGIFERLALAEMAEKRGEADQVTLTRLIREAALRELVAKNAT